VVRIGSILICALALQAQLASAEPVDFGRQIKPFLKERCYACHGAVKQKAGLRLDTAVALKRGGDSGPAVDADPADSLIIERVTAADEASRMPPEGQPLTPGQIELLTEWIRQGAPLPAHDEPDQDPREHWAFRRIERPALPPLGSRTAAANPIDMFVAKERERKGLTGLPPAESSVLLRRVTLDLTGLPPTREELHAFLADESEIAFEKVVERLLASPSYGERWGRHWMDVWRYSDWYGRRAVPDVMNSYAQIWRWRDWIVRSLNHDKGYDRMVEEMLAADEIAPDDAEAIVATGFIVRNWYKWNYEVWMKELVEHTGKAFLGLTFNCAQCHDHKYDPISQEEYFRFRAFFEPLELRHDRVPGEPDPGPFKKYVYAESYGPISSGLVRIFDEKLDAQTFMFAGGDARNKMEGKPPVTPGAPAALGGDHLKIEPVSLSLTSWYPGLRPFIQQEETDRAAAAVTAAEAVLAKSKQLLAAAERQIAEIERQGKAAPAQAAAGAAAAPSPESTQKAQTELEDARLTLRVDETQLLAVRTQALAINSRIAADRARYAEAPANPSDAAQFSIVAAKAERLAAMLVASAQLARAERTLAVARRTPPASDKAKADLAAAQQQLVAVNTAFQAAQTEFGAASDQYSPLTPLYPKQSTGRRTALARWIVSRENPLAARVAVNHLWMRHFGSPLVETTFNLGRNGKPPTHPELLDWLAAEFIDSGWSMKHMHRLIVTSQAYRRKSGPVAASDPNLAIDPDNRLLWRFNVQRMEGEEIRDGVLAASEQLDRTMGGADIDMKLGLTSWRRSLYYTHHGEEKMEFLNLFDGANPTDCYRRAETVVPQQALAMVNSEFSHRESRLLARSLWDRVQHDPPPSGNKDETFVIAAFEQILARSPSAEMKTAAVKFLGRQATEFRALDPKQLAATPTAGEIASSADPDQRARENLIHALMNHNEFVTIR
jgi:hypothetical protein